MQTSFYKAVSQGLQKTPLAKPQDSVLSQKPHGGEGLHALVFWYHEMAFLRNQK